MSISRSSNNQQLPIPSVKQIIVGIVIFILLIVGFSTVRKSFYTVDSGNVGIIKRYGEVVGTAQPGLHLKLPFAETVVEMSTQTQAVTVAADAGTVDMQTVTTNIGINYHLDPKQVAHIYTSYSDDYENRIILPRIQESVKAVVAKFNAEELLAQRETIKSQINMMLTKQLSSYDIVMEDLQITHFKFSGEFDRAIEAKQTAAQTALKAKNDLDRVKYEADQKVTTAQAEADALRAQKDQITPELLQLRQVEVQQEMVKRWNGVLPTTCGSSSNPLTMMMQPSNK